MTFSLGHRERTTRKVAPRSGDATTGSVRRSESAGAGGVRSRARAAGSEIATSGNSLAVQLGAAGWNHETERTGPPTRDVVQRDWIDDIGTLAGVVGLGGSAVQGVADIGTAIGNDVASGVSSAFGSAAPAPQAATPLPGMNLLGIGTSAIGLATGARTMLDDEASTPDRVVGGMSAFGGLTGLLSSAGINGLSAWISAGGTAGLAATTGSGFGVGTSFASGGLLAAGGTALGTLGLLASAGAAGYGVGTMLKDTEPGKALGDNMQEMYGHIDTIMGGDGEGSWMLDTYEEMGRDWDDGNYLQSAGNAAALGAAGTIGGLAGVGESILDAGAWVGEGVSNLWDKVF